jgi:hypothetical protein
LGALRSRDLELIYSTKHTSEKITDVVRETHHLMGNSVIELDGDTARVETYCIAHHRSHPTPASNQAMIGTHNLSPEQLNQEMELVIGIRYLDVVERRDGVWKIKERSLVFDWSRVGRYGGIEAGGLYEVTYLRGSTDRSDPLYSLL